MGWKGTIRSVGAAVRAAERDARRKQRELEKLERQYEKMEELERAEYEVAVYENEIEIIQSLHKECAEPVEWFKISDSTEPAKPVNRKNRESEARIKLENFKPNLVERIFKTDIKKLATLNSSLEKAIEDDLKELDSRISAWEEKVSDWKEKIKFSKRILSGDNEAKIEAIENINPFKEISNLGSNVAVSINEEGIVEAEIRVHGDSIIPGESKSLLKSGKLSVKSMPKGKFNEIYQDYVCSCVLRVANELFSILPDDLAIVTATDELLNTKTGHLEQAPILSICASRGTLNKLNLSSIDPSDSMENFIYNMSFKKTKGFEPVSKVVYNVLEGA